MNWCKIIHFQSKISVPLFTCFQFEILKTIWFQNEVMNNAAPTAWPRIGVNFLIKQLLGTKHDKQFAVSVSAILHWRGGNILEEFQGTTQTVKCSVLR